MAVGRDLFSGRLALITGGSSGIGLALARRLAWEGADVWLLARHRDALQSSLESLPTRPESRHGLLEADVSNWEQVQYVVERFLHEAGIPDLLINSAGWVAPGYAVELVLDQYRQMMDVNYFGTVHMVKACLPSMLQRGSGHIVNIASAAAFVTGPGYAAYSPSKYAVRAFSDVLRAEMKPHGLKVSVVFPPDTDTPQLAYEKSHKAAELLQFQEEAGIGPFLFGVMSADDVAADILKGICQDRYIILPGTGNAVLYRLVGHLGKLVYSMVDDQWAGVRRRHAKR